MTPRRVGVIWPKQASSRCREMGPGAPEKATNNRAEACRRRADLHRLHRWGGRALD